MSNSNVKIYKVQDLSIAEDIKHHKKRFFSKRRKFIEPHWGLVFEHGDTYEANKRAWHDALALVYSNKCKDIFEAHEIFG